jgi:hypothetical protein
VGFPKLEVTNDFDNRSMLEFAAYSLVLYYDFRLIQNDMLQKRPTEHVADQAPMRLLWAMLAGGSLARALKQFSTP